MIRFVIGDATRPEGDRRAIIVHCVNNCSAWGAGFVLALSARWPEPEADFRSAPMSLGEVRLVRVADGIHVANLCGQHGIGRTPSGAPIRYDAIRAGLVRVRELARIHDADIHAPRFGSGLAGGSWSLIEAIVRDELVAHGIDVTVYELPAR